MAEKYVMINSVMHKNTNSDKLDNVYIADLVNRRIKLCKFKDFSSLSTIDPINYKYYGDVVTIAKSIGTLAYINTEHKFYGILKFTYSGKPMLMWISYDNFWNDDKNENVCNIKNDLIDITDQGEAVLSKDWFKGVKSMTVDNLLSRRTSLIDFKIAVGFSQPNTPLEEEGSDINTTTDDVNTTTDDINTTADDINTATIVENENTVDKIDESIASFNDTYIEDEDDDTVGIDINEENTEETELNNNTIDNNTNIDLNDLIKREAELMIKQMELNRLQSELEKKTRRIDELLQSLENKEFTDVISKMIEVDNIYTFEDRVQLNEYGQSDYMSEMVLKYISNNDTVTISKAYYSKLCTYMIKQLDANLSYSKYSAIVKIKFESTSEYCLYAIVEYDESVNYVRLSVIKRYDTTDITDDIILQYYRQYMAIQKKLRVS